MKLSKEQIKHYESIKWLLDPIGPRGMGKTQLMAMVFY